VARSQERSSTSLPPCGAEYLSRRQAAALANVSTQTLDKWIRQKRLKASAPSRKVLINRADLRRCMEDWQL
jgi:excisionase family DNA binding protein